MQTSTSSASQPNDYGLLLLLQEVRNDKGSVVQHFVCYDCLDLVERETGSVCVHDCAPRRDATTLRL
jgi:hypothetical protein